jgi:hypothetical protein
MNKKVREMRYYQLQNEGRLLLINLLNELTKQKIWKSLGYQPASQVLQALWKAKDIVYVHLQNQGSQIIYFNLLHLPIPSQYVDSLLINQIIPETSLKGGTIPSGTPFSCSYLSLSTLPAFDVE